ARIAAGARVRRSVIGRYAVVGTDSTLDAVVVGDGAKVGAGNELPSGIRVGCGVTLAPEAVRLSAAPTPCAAPPLASLSGIPHMRSA
ncbi:hypothetical protein GT002_10440, partial [Streptomyces sp. SID4917]